MYASIATVCRRKNQTIADAGLTDIEIFEHDLMAERSTDLLML
ncbi:hypothetical protein [Gynuella sp.]